MSAYNPYARRGRKSIDGIPTATGKDEELTRRAEDDAFRAHLANMADHFPQPKKEN